MNREEITLASRLIFLPRPLPIRAIYRGEKISVPATIMNIRCVGVRNSASILPLFPAGMAIVLFI